MSKRVAIVLPAEVTSIDDTQRAFGPLGNNLSNLVRASDLIEIDYVDTQEASVEIEAQAIEANNDLHYKCGNCGECFDDPLRDKDDILRCPECVSEEIECV